MHKNLETKYGSKSLKVQKYNINSLTINTYQHLIIFTNHFLLLVLNEQNLSYIH